MKLHYFLFFIFLILLSFEAIAAPSSNLPNKDADPLGMKGQAFTTHTPKVNKVYESNLRKQIQSLQSANRYSKKAYSSEKFSTLKRNARKTVRAVSKILPEGSIPQNQEYKNFLNKQSDRTKALEARILSTGQSMYVYSKLALESRNWKEAQGYMKQAMQVSDELLYPERQAMLESGDFSEYVKSIL